MSAPAPSSDKHLDIRKYPNRRYYDATHSRHMTLEEIRSLIRDGYDIQVTDSRTGADITAQVLTQIILELETPKINSFPVALLLRMIRSNDQVVRDFVETYFNQAFKAYLDYQKQMEERWRQMQGMGGLFPPYAAWAQTATAPFAGAFGAKPPSPNEKDAAGPAPAPASTPAAESADLRNTVTELQQQLAALKAELKAGKSKRGTRKR
jgi:polyhydroxyalkanoate synthesis repressor PhaR